MRVSRLSLTDFRNYRTAEVVLAPGVNVFVGANGQGKTNLVEAVAYLSTLGSHRTSSDQPLIRDGASSAVIRAMIERDGRRVLLEVQINRAGANRARVNRAPARPRQVPRHLTTVVFAPEDLALVRGDPAVRRNFIDGYLAQRTPRLSAVLADYDRVLRQRNSLLKSARFAPRRPSAGGSPSTLEIWDEKLVDLGSRVIAARLAAVAELAGPVVRAYRAIGGSAQVPGLRLSSGVLDAAAEQDGPRSTDPARAPGEGPDPRAAAPAGGGRPAADLGTAVPQEAEIRGRFAAALRTVRSRELERGVSLVGPHRDDVVLSLNGMPARSHSSHGESWTFALALRLGIAESLRAAGEGGGDPVLILDDVFAELDRTRAHSLAGAVAGFEQVLVTSAVWDDVPAGLDTHSFRVADGTVRPASPGGDAV